MSASDMSPETWVDEHGDILFRYAVVRVRDREQAEELVQETFVAALRALATYDGRSAPRTWLIGILRHKLMDFFRDRWRGKVSADDPAAEPGGDWADSAFDAHGHWKNHKPSEWSDPRAAMQQGDFLRVLNECLAALPGRLADVFTLREMEETDTEEVCKVLGITATNLWAMMHRARARLRLCLDVKWFGKRGARE